MGVSGSGKSTVAGILAGQLGWDLVEGDDLHPAANVAKMSAGIPLADEDRWPWLDRVAAWIRNHTATGVPGIITCSALKRSYRDKLSGDNVVFVHLAGSKDIIGQRLTARTDHYMPATLLYSQIATRSRRKRARTRYRSWPGEHRPKEPPRSSATNRL